MDIREIEFIVLDTETTGIDPDLDTVIEIAASKYVNGEVDDLRVWRVNPGFPIPPGAMSVHHITDKDVAKEDKRNGVVPLVQDYVGKRTVVAHNAPFDRSMLPELAGNDWLCTLRFAQQLWAHGTLNAEGDPLPNHKNQTLRHWLGLKEKTGAAHRADADLALTSGILRAEIAEYLARGNSPELEDLLKFIAAPRLLEKFTVGKYEGVPMELVPNDYFRSWLDKAKRGQKVDNDILHTCQHHYTLRAKNRAAF